MTDTAATIQTKTGALLDFLEDFYRLSTPPVRDIADFNDFVLRDAEVPAVHGVELSPAGDAWLTSTLVSHAPAPPVPDEFAAWLPQRTLSPIHTPTLKEPDDDAGPPPTAGFDGWVAEQWQPWSEQWHLIERSREFYKNLYGLRARVERDRDGVELVWGFGRLRWTTPQGTIDHPLVTVPVELSLDEEGRLEVAPSGPTQIESAFLGEVDLAGRADYLALRQCNRADDIELWVDAGRDELLGQLLRFIDHDGELLPTAPPPANHAVVGDEWVLYLRRRQADYVAFIEAQRQLYRDGADPSLPFLSLVTDEPSALAIPPGGVESDGRAEEPADNTLFLPKPANEEQYRILHLAQTRPGVTAQGPPGTGKSHTIANLICHFVAQGQRVLVTAEKEQALSVLTGKLPPAVRELTVSVLGSDQGAQTRLEAAINTIQEKVSTYDAVYLNAEISRLTKAIADIDAESAVASNELRAARTAETTPLTGVWEAGSEPSPSRAAEWLHTHEADLGFIDDPLAPSTPVPVSAPEWEELLSLTAALNPSDLAACALKRPDPAELLTGAELARRHDELTALRSRLADADGVVTSWDLVDIAGATVLAQLTASIQDALAWRRKTAGTWFDQVRVEAATPVTRQEWSEFVDGLTGTREEVLAHRRAVAAYDVTVPSPASDEVKVGLREAEERFSAGKGVSRLLQRSAAKALELCQVDGRHPSTADQVGLCSSAIARNENRRRLQTRWANGTKRADGPGLDDARPPEDAVADHLGGLAAALAWSTYTWPTLAAQFGAIGVRCPIDPNVEDLDSLAATMEVMSARARERALTAELEAVARYLKDGMSDGASPLWGGLAEANARRAWDRWDELAAETARVASLTGRAERLGVLHGCLTAAAPRWANRVATTRAAGAPDHQIVCRAWQWRQLDGLVAHITAGPSAAVMQRQLEDLAHRRLVVMEELVAVRAWRGLAAGFDDKKRGALNKYLAAAKKLGPYSKYRSRFLREIRDALDESKGAVPVWVMPTTRVLSSFRPEATPPFDVLIVDEASQIGLLGVPILSLARKAIVVGDDQQTSPENVGLHRQPVYDLIDDHLHQVKNAVTLFDPDNSLYDLSRQQFPEVVVLREHFRCLPQIIAFSNSRYYHGRMIPLRDKAPAHDWQAVGTVFVPDGVRDGKDTNQAEAQAVVDLLTGMCADPAYDSMTFGVVTLLSGGQSKRIQDMLLDRFGPDILEERRVRCGDAAMFQGDERDVIVLSTVVDRAEGRRIGAMTDKKAERRLNVAASRAQNQMWVVHSVEAVDFPTGDPRAELIRYCENPGGAETVYTGAEQLCESQFERDVLRRIIDKGYRRVRCQHEVGRYRIDIVVIGADNGSLAVECDGDAWHGPDRWDEDRARQQKLERAGLTFERITGSAFYRRPDQAMEPLWARLDELDIRPGSWNDEPSGRGPNRRVAPTLAERFGTEEATTGHPIDTPVAAAAAPAILKTEPARATEAVRPSLAAPEGGRLRATQSAGSQSPGLEQPAPKPVTAVPEPVGEPPPGSWVASPQPVVEVSGRAGAEEVAAALTPYAAWETRPVGAVLDSDPERVLSELTEILAAEGPLHGFRLYQLHSRAAGGQRVGREMRSAYNQIVSRALRGGSIARVEDDLPGVIDKTLFTPGTPHVLVRTIGPRQLQDIPRSEIATLILRLGLDSADPGDVKRHVLNTLGLLRLTKNASDYLDSCIAYRWS